MDSAQNKTQTSTPTPDPAVQELDEQLKLELLWQWYAANKAENEATLMADLIEEGRVYQIPEFCDEGFCQVRWEGLDPDYAVTVLREKAREERAVQREVEKVLDENWLQANRNHPYVQERYREIRRKFGRPAFRDLEL